MSKFNKLFIIKILLTFLVALTLSSFLINKVFIAASPKINPGFEKELTYQIKNSITGILNKVNLASLFKRGVSPIAEQDQQQVAQTIDRLKSRLNPIAKGVRAGSEGNVSVTEFTMSEIEWVEVEFNLSDGRKITITYPKGTQPPPKEMFEK